MVVETGELSGCFPRICHCDNVRKYADILINFKNNELDFVRSNMAFCYLCLLLDYYG